MGKVLKVYVVLTESDFDDYFTFEEIHSIWTDRSLAENAVSEKNLDSGATRVVEFILDQA